MVPPLIRPAPALRFRNGLLVFAGGPLPDALAGYFRRTPQGGLVASGYHYADILREAAARGIPLDDQATAFDPLAIGLHREEFDPFDFQLEAIREWVKAGQRGTVVLPTGAGKSYTTRLLIASLAVRDARCSALIIVPTRVLLYQWHAQLRRAFRRPIGIIGDDQLDIRPISVTTYTSARLHMSWFGNRWKLLVFDEVHRKLSTGPSGNVARFAIAPYRLGLTATPIEKEQPLLEDLVGPVVYSRTTGEMIEREVLSVYRRVSVQCRPAPDEIRTYYSLRKPMDDLWLSARKAHRVQGSDWFLRERRIRPDAVALALRSVLRAHRYWASIPSRLDRLREILRRHPNDRILIFTESRAAAYEVSRTLLIPAITADVGGDEREAYLAAFAEGRCRALVTARALEEGVDLPDANVAVMLAGRKQRGTESIQFIQRRGRVLRKREGKEAVVYEVSWSVPRSRKTLT